ncbi:hypothetical protein Ahy_A10g048169 [Arachis hypogaea]|uniref:Uncharacterized protein n=1 Tax=Arachis hypogaea TaxID=3818 RepID=A0A445B4G1_ARAHY|nr:hypothetical protein Ahy_A10g048169 [Arachis hypogaea]
MDRESFRVNIVDTENERSDCSDEDDLEDRFIDDNPIPEVLVYVSDDIKPEGKKNKHGWLKKKYHLVESDDDGDEVYMVVTGEPPKRARGCNTRTDFGRKGYLVGTPDELKSAISESFSV